MAGRAERAKLRFASFALLRLLAWASQAKCGMQALLSQVLRSHEKCNCFSIQNPHSVSPILAEEILVRCCSFLASDGTVSPPVGWAAASNAMSEIFDGNRRGSARVVVVELGAGSVRLGGQRYNKV